MKAEQARFMWLFVFFDLPVGSKDQRRGATRFRHFLKNDGYMMLQYSVYARVCRGQDAVEKHVKRTRLNLPIEGSIRVLQITDKQFGRMELMLGAAPKNERIGPTQLVLL